MKTFKKADLIISIALIILGIGFALIEKGDQAIYGYFLVGGWQLISMIVHQYYGWFTEKRSRRSFYHCTVLILIILALLSLLVPVIMMILLFILLFVAPVMALYYTGICYDEVYVKMARPLAQLK